MREPENLRELIEYLKWSYERMEDDADVVCSLTDGDGFHELFKNLKEDHMKIYGLQRKNKGENNV